MNDLLLNEMINEWEPQGAEVVRIIDTTEDTIERILKFDGEYYLFRYFMLRSLGKEEVCVSADLQAVDADRVIQELAERL